MNIFIKDLHEGVHEFKESILASEVGISQPEFYPNPLGLEIYVDRLDNIYRVRVRIKTRANFVCDRCLESFNTDVDETVEQIYQLGSGTLDEDDEVEMLPVDTREIVLDKMLQDAFIISRSIQMLCSEACKGLCAHCGTNLNQKQCKCAADQIDPRLEKLKSFLN